MSKTRKIIAFSIILVMILSIIPLNSVKAGVTDAYHIKIENYNSITNNSDKSVTANYDKGTMTVNIESGSFSTLGGTLYVTSNEQITVTVTPTREYSNSTLSNYSTIKVDGTMVDLSANNKYTVAESTEALAVEPMFSAIERITTTNYYTTIKLEGTLTNEKIGSDTPYNYSSSELTGNVEDSNVTTEIRIAKNGFETFVNENEGTNVSYTEEITNYYYDAHDEITAPNSGDFILVGDIDDLYSIYNRGNTIINTILDKHQTYTITATATMPSIKKITSANITLKAPKVGDEVKKITKNDGYEDYDAQDVAPAVSTTTEGLTVNAFWVKGLEDLSEESFYGTFEKDTYYYALIDFEAEDGYELPSTFPDGIKINGVAPDEVFAVMGGKWNHCIAKIKATEIDEVIVYTILDGADQTYTEGEDIVVRASGDLNKLLMLKVDGEELSTENYTLKSGSTIATLKSSYLNTLSEGNHTVTFVYNDGEVDATLKVLAAQNTSGDDTNTTGDNTNTGTETNNNTTNDSSTGSPQTGDNIVNYVITLILSIIGLAGGSLYLNKKKIFANK